LLRCAQALSAAHAHKNCATEMLKEKTDYCYTAIGN